MRRVAKELAARPLGPQEGDPLVYHVDDIVLGPQVMSKWVQLSKDAETDAFLETCVPSALKDGMATVLRTFMSRTDANGLLDRGKMFVLSQAQLLKICPALPDLKVRQGKPLALLDIGSGDGSVTSVYAKYFERIVTTETSSVMAKKLREKGWECYEPPHEELPDESFDVITCMNVLDRADKPLSLLESLRVRLKPETGYLILAVVLPWCPFVEDGAKQRQPSEKLEGMSGNCCRDGATFEQSLKALVENVLTKIGFDIVSISRVPYISQGDQIKRYYVLSDAIILCKRKR